MVEKLQFYPIDITYKVIENKAVIYLFGRTVNNEQVCVTDETFKPYFYVFLKDNNDIDDFVQKIKRLKVEDKNNIAEVSKTEIVDKKFLGREKKAVKVFVNIPSDVPVIRTIIKDWYIVESTHEFDIPFTRRYLIDKSITPLVLTDAEGEFISMKCRVPVFRVETIKQTSTEAIQKPKILAFDIEVYNPNGKRFSPDNDPIIMISFYGDNLKKVVTWKRFDTNLDYVEFVNGEAELIERFKDIIGEYKPDMISGYFSDGFDLPYIAARAKRYDIALDLGLDYSHLKIRRRKKTIAHVNGITHLDVFAFISKIMGRSMDTESYSLRKVSTELLGETKKEVELDNLADVWDNHPEALDIFCEYNLHDSYLVYELCLKVIPNIKELVKIIGLPIDDLSRMGFSQLVEWYIIKNLREFNEIASNKPNYYEVGERKEQTYKGAFVYEPEPGLFDDIAVFDFRSLYPTIIVSHNIGLSTLNCECCTDEIQRVPVENKDYWFCRKTKGFIPKLVERLITRRMRIKEMLKQDKEDALLKARADVLKLLANSFYGYLGFFGSRWYSLECADSVTAYGRHYITKVIENAKAEGFKVLYGDSVTSNRFIVLIDKKGILHIKNIEEFFKENIKNMKSIGEKEVIDIDGYKTPTVNPDTKKASWEKLKTIIRHKNNKKIFRVNQKYGETQVTEDHSIICSKGKNFVELKPTQISNENHLIKIVKIPSLNEIKQIDVYEVLKNYSYKVKYKGRVKTAKAFCDDELVWFGLTKRTKAVKVKRFIETGTEEFNALCRLFGSYIPEGSSSTPETTKSRLGASISTGNVSLLNQLQKDYHLLFKNSKVSVIRSQKEKRNLSYINSNGVKKEIIYEDKTYKLQMMNILSAVFFKMFCGQKSKGKKLPWFIYHIEDKYKKIILDNIIEGDGSRSVNKNLGYSEKYKKNFFKYSTQSLELVSGLSFLLTQLNQRYSIRYRPAKKEYSITTSSKFNKRFITKITEETYSGYVYDLEVENTHIFIDACGQILLHNTDSVFLALQEKTEEEAKRFVEIINSKLPGLMELEFESYFKRGIFVSAKEGSYGAKKKYAMIDSKNNMKIKGFETIRGNWSPVAKETQYILLEIILKEKDIKKALDYVKKVILDLKEKKISREKLTIHTRLQKELNDYIAIGPHVAIGRLLRARGMDVGAGSRIDYIVAPGKGIIRDRVKLPDEAEDYDSDYYINNQVIPAVESIFKVLGFEKEELLGEKKQSKLDGFF